MAMSFAAYTYHLPLLTTIVLAWIAWVVGRAPAQGKANRLLAAFLAVVAAGYALQFLNNWTARVEQTDPFPLRVLEQLAGMLDPPLLLAYALTFPRPRAAAASKLLWGSYAAGALALSAPYLGFFSLPDETGLRLLIHLYVNGTYFAAFLLLLDAYAKEPRRYLSRELRLLAIGVGFIALSRSAAFFLASGPAWAPGAHLGTISLGAALGYLLLGVASAIHRARSGGEARSAASVLVPVAVLLGAFSALWALTDFLDQALGLREGRLWTYYFGYRWIAFGLIVGYGMLRYQLFDFDLRVRQAAGLFLAATLGLLVAMGVGAAWEEAGAPIPSAQSAALVGGAGGVALLHVLLRRAIAQVFPRADDPTAFHQRRLEIYEATLEHALGKAEWSEGEHRFVETLRDVFEVTPEEHEEVAARVRRGG